jgi:hypothetical protein
VTEGGYQVGFNKRSRSMTKSSLRTSSRVSSIVCCDWRVASRLSATISVVRRAIASPSGDRAKPGRHSVNAFIRPPSPEAYTRCAESEPRPPAFPGVAESRLRGGFLYGQRSPQRPTVLAAIRARSAGSSRTIVPSGRADTKPSQTLRSRSSAAPMKALSVAKLCSASPIRSGVVALDDPFHLRSSVPSSARDDTRVGEQWDASSRISLTCPRARVMPHGA